MQKLDPTVITHNLQPIAAGLATTLGTGPQAWRSAF